MRAKTNLLQFPKRPEYRLVCTNCGFLHRAQNFNLAQDAKRLHEQWLRHDVVILLEPIRAKSAGS